MTGFIDKVGEAIHQAKSNAHDMATVTKSLAEEKLLDVPYVDLTIQFIGASGIPKMDVVGSADPYFVAKLDNRISFVSTVKINTLTPVWNELWRIKNVPSTADLHVEVLDKDVGAPHDDYIGKFKCSVAPGAKELEIEGPVFRRNRGTFWLKIESKPSTEFREHTFLFDGPIRYSRHHSPTVGLLTNLDGGNARLYSTWKMYLVGVPIFFKDVHQPWNKNYKAAQNIFQGPASIAVRSGIQAGHRMLYARSTSNGFGVIENDKDFIALLHTGSRRPPSMNERPPAEDPNQGTSAGNASNGQRLSDDKRPNHDKRVSRTLEPFANRVKPAVYTYIISSEDESFRFSETGAAFFVDFASKHALHSNCAETVRYSGEFHPRPRGGWDAFSDNVPDDEVQWELVLDNNSGTYSPDKAMLPALKHLFEYNFGGFAIVALDHEDEELVKSREACRAYALRCRGVKDEELQPHAGEGEVTLSYQASTKIPVPDLGLTPEGAKEM